MDLIHHYIELIAALAASYYWLKTKDRSTLPFIYYLWLTVIIETLALYTFFYNIDNVILNFLEDSVMRRNTWLYNIYSILGLILLGIFFRRQVDNLKSKRIINVVVIGTTSIVIGYFIVSGNFFKMMLPYETLLQTVAIFIMVMLYYRELLRSKDVLKFYKSHIFYLSSALLLWNICLTPLFLFDGYYKKLNIEFIAFRRDVLLISNLLLYSCYTFAFLFTLYHKNRLVQSKSH